MLYADDVTLYATVNNIIDANRYCQIILKNVYSCVSGPASKLDFVNTLGGVNLQLVEHARLLGIILSQNMSVTNRSDNVASQGLK